METSNFNEQLEQLAIDMFEAQCLLFGSFTLSSGVTISAYLDLITLLSHPKVLNRMCDVAHLMVEELGLKVQNVCGVSYGGIPFAALIAHKFHLPMLIRNKELSLSPNDLRVVGNIYKGSEVLVIEEVVCSATSTLQTIKDIEDAGLIVKDVLVMVDLEQGGETNLCKMGYRLHSVFKLSQLAKILYDKRYLNEERVEDIRIGWKEKFAPNGDCITDTTLEKRKCLGYESRVPQLQSKISRRIFQLIIQKRSNLCVNLCSPDFNKILKTAEQIGPHICILGIHLDSLDAVAMNRIDELKNIAKKYGFLIFDDRKLSENGCELRCLVRKTLRLVDLVTVFPLAGESTLNEINSMSNMLDEKGVIIVSSCLMQDSLVNSSFERHIVKLSLQCCPSITGFISHQNSDIPLSYIHMMQDIRTTSAVTNNKTVDSYYAENVITQKLAADVVMLSVDCNEGTLDLVKKKQSISWVGYENRFHKNGFYCESNNKLL